MMTMNDDKSPSDRFTDEKVGHKPGGSGLFVTFIFGESWQLLYILLPLFLFHFSVFPCFFLVLGKRGWKGVGGCNLFTCWFLAALFWSLSLGD